MSSDAVRPKAPARRRPRAGVVAAALCLSLASALPGAAATADDLFRQVKVDVFDQDWTAVLRGCDEILARYPSEPTAAQAAFYRARALTRIPGREAEGLKAFKGFITVHPRDRVMVEQASVAIFPSPCRPRRAATTCCPSSLNGR